MRKVYPIFCLLAVFFFGNIGVEAQSYAISPDTAFYTPDSAGGDTVTFFTSGSISLDWKVVATDFPADWQAATTICDNLNCYPFFLLWPSTLIRHTGPISHPGGMAFDISTGHVTTAGCYYCTIRSVNAAITTDTSYATFVTCYMPAKVEHVSSQPASISPNPATDIVTIVHGADATNIIVYDLTGKAIQNKTITGNTTNLDISALPSGLYFVSLHGIDNSIVANLKFMKR